VCGLITVDAADYPPVKEIVRQGETISSTQFERRPGGKGANQAVAIAKALANSARGKVDLQCCVGEDGRWIVNQLEELGVFSGGVVVVKVLPIPNLPPLC
jgi:ribokinase